MARQFANSTNICNDFSGLGYSPQFCSAYNGLISTYSSKTTDQKFYYDIKLQESDIMSSTLVNQKEVQILLTTASVLRYSNYYSEQPDNIAKWQQFASTQAQAACCGGVAKSDASGAIAGGVAGAIVGGTVATPLGSAPGWVVGAVAWGAGSSEATFVGWLTGWW